MSYRIIRKYFRDDIEDEVIETGLTLQEAQDHCSDPETSSKTCTYNHLIILTHMNGPWFHSYEQED